VAAARPVPQFPSSGDANQTVLYDGTFRKVFVDALGGNDGGRRAVIGGVADGLVGAGLEMITGALVKDVTFMIVTDIQLVEKAPSGAFVRTDIQIDSKKGSGGRATQTLSTVTDSIK
jgi:hypothetical protein